MIRLIMVFIICLFIAGNVQAQDEQSLKGLIAQALTENNNLRKRVAELELKYQEEKLSSRVNALEERSIDRYLAKDATLTPMPGWVMLPASKYKLLWNVQLLHKKWDDSVLKDVECYEDRTGANSCFLKYELDNFSNFDVEGVVVNFMTRTSANASHSSVSCSDGQGGFNEIMSHYMSNGFVNYGSSPSVHDWENGIIFCPLVDSDGKKVLKVKFSTNSGESRRVKDNLETIATVLGYW